jgi:tRNA (cmo5U34)-methyltransferase
VPSDKSTIAEIRERFDADVERFSDLSTGQASAVDGALAMDLVAAAAARVTPGARRLLDVGCGAGNYTLMLLRRLPGLDVTLVDLSANMLARAHERVAAAGAGTVTTLQADVNELELPEGGFDVIVAAAVLHHLREDADWERVYGRLCASLAPGGSLWVYDLVEASLPEVQRLQWERYGEYLAGIGGGEYREKVFAYVAREDTPRPLLYQLDLMRRNGLEVEVLHANACFAAFGGVRSG